MQGSMFDPTQEMAVSWRGDEANVTSIQRALSSLLTELNPTEEGQPHPPIRASLLNRIVWLENGSRAEESRAYQAMMRLAQAHPSRTLFITEDRESSQSGLDASATVHCLLQTGTEPRVCLEEVRLVVRGELAGHLSGVVGPLLIPDMPVVLWWLGNPPRQEETLLEECDRLVLDSGPGGPRGLKQVQSLMEAWGRRLMISDVAWAQLGTWREMLSQLFDPLETRPYQQEITEVEIEYAPGAIGTQPFLLLGWLASQMGWRLPDRGPTPTERVLLQGTTGQIEVGIRASSSAPGLIPGDLYSVMIRAQRGGKEALFSVSRCEDRMCAHIRRSLPGRPASTRTVPLPESAWTEMLSRELDQRSRDPGYPRSLAIAVPLAAAMDRTSVTVVPDLEALTVAAAEMIYRVAEESIAARGRFAMALSGGSTPGPLYRLMASEPWRSRIDWSRCHLFWGDERLVPPDDPDSNYRLAWESLLSRVPIPDPQIHRVPVEAGDANAVAAAYEADLREFFNEREKKWPAMDLMLQGLGSDGHTASLFPGHPSLLEDERWVVATPPGTLPPTVDRVTMTLPAINESPHILFLVAGADKSEVVQRVLAGDLRLPAARALSRTGTVYWLLDSAAARSL